MNRERLISAIASADIADDLKGHLHALASDGRSGPDQLLAIADLCMGYEVASARCEVVDPLTQAVDAELARLGIAMTPNTIREKLASIGATAGDDPKTLARILSRGSVQAVPETPARKLAKKEETGFVPFLITLANMVGRDEEDD